MKACIAALSVLLGQVALAQVPFPPNTPNAPVGPARQAVYPYAGQCYTGAPIDGLPACSLANAKSFACAAPGISHQSAFSSACGAVTAKAVVSPIDPATQPKFQWEVLNPLDYTPVTTDPTTGADLGYDYYEIAVHEAQGFQGIASAGLFPNPTAVPAGGAPFTPVPGGVPNGKQWTGLVCPAGAACAAGTPLFTPIWGVGQVNLGGGPVTSTLAGLGLFTPAAPSPWSANNYVATWPSISIRGTKGRPVRVRWINEFPDNHLFCPHPEAADWPCAIDRTFMGVKASIDPQKAPPTFNATTGIVPYAVNQFGSPQQPDNSWVTHLHGGEIPPGVDGFAEKWYGNATTGPLYSPTPFPLNPAFGAPYDALARGDVASQLTRPGGAPGGASSWQYDTYTYPMVNDEATIWFHDHTLGKTHHNVIAGPAGFFPVKDPSKHNPIVNGVCQVGGNPAACEYTWLDPVTEPRGALGIPSYDLFLALQDRTFSDDGTINFSNGLGQAPLAPPANPLDPNYPACLLAPPPGNCTAPGTTPWTNGPQPQVHPTWVPEYFGDHALVNGVLWPKKTVSPGWYRVRFVNGSDARCYVLGLGTVEPAYATAAAAAANPIRNVPFTVIANEQGYLPAAVANQTSLTICPGERYELLVNFGGRFNAYTDPVTGARVPAGPLAGKQVFVSNTAGAPYPNGLTPQVAASPFAHLASIMRFDVATAAQVPALGLPAPVPSCATGEGATWPGSAAAPQRSCIAIPPQIDLDFVSVAGLTDCPKDAAGHPITTAGPCIAATRQLFLNEKADGITGTSLGMQINGLPFEYDVTETPRQGTYEKWIIINTTVDAHPIHPHLVKAQVVSRQAFNQAGWKRAFCGAPACDPVAAPGGAPLVAPDITPFLRGNLLAIPAAEAGWKDAMRAPPGQVTTFIAHWDGAWKQPGLPVGDPRACSAVDNVSCFEPVTAGPYVWHCHINSHEDSEMMRSSLVVK